MKVMVEDAGPCRKIMRVDVPAEKVLPDYEEILNEYSRLAKLPGFRKGKAPRKVVEARFTKELVDDAREQTIPRFYRQALEDRGITPVAVLSVDDTRFSKEDGLSFSVTIDVAPEFKLPKYKKISLKSERESVTDEQVENTIKQLRLRFSRYEDAEGRGVQENDLALIDYAGTCDGQPIGTLAENCSGLGEGTDYLAMVAEPEFIPGLPLSLVGMNVGEEKDIDVTFPDDFHVEAVAGKKARYHVTLKNIREPILPELDGEFLKHFDVETPEALTAKIRGQMEEAADENEKRRLREEISKFLVAKTKLDVPASVVEQETRLMVRDIVQRSSRQGITPEQLEGQREQIFNAAASSSVDRVKVSYILARIASEEGIEVSDEEFDARISQMAARYGMPEEQFKAEMDKRNTMEQFKSDIRSDKTMDFLLEHAKIKK